MATSSRVTPDRRGKLTVSRSHAKLSIQLIRYCIFGSTLILVLISFSILYFQVRLDSLYIRDDSAITLPVLADTERPDRSTLTKSLNEISIFYNVYIPKFTGDGDQYNNALRIVHEQLLQLLYSHVTNPNHNHTPVLYYVTIGTSLSFDYTKSTTGTEHADGKDFIQQQPFCEQYQCRHLQHYDAGFEEVTLQHLWQHCQSHSNARVVYMHSKGSFHNRGENVNDRWRQHMTAAVTSQQCIEHTDNSECNTCGLLFQTLPTLHFPGNFWTAKCSHVQQLIEPSTFEAKMKQVHDKFWYYYNDTNAIVKHRITMNLYELLPWSLGSERYKWEHWIGTHPGMVPCDLSPTLDLDKWKNNDKIKIRSLLLLSNTTDPSEKIKYLREYVSSATSMFDWKAAPRYPSIKSQHWTVKPRPEKKVLLDKTSGDTEWTLLPGHLIKWITLYNLLPPVDSWLYSYFGGDNWKGRVKKHNLAVVDQYFGKYDPSTSSSKRQLDTSNINVPLSTSSSSSTALQLGGDVSLAPNHSIFYNVFIPSDAEGAKNALRIVKEQIKQVSESYAGSNKAHAATLYYVTIGRDNVITPDVMSKLCSGSNGLRCVHLQHLVEGHEDSTLQHLYNFCQTNPKSDHRVAYIHSKGSLHLFNGRNDRWRRHMTMAATSEMCLNPPNETCNICGLNFYPVWNIFFPGNMWSATCEYVKNLISPDQFPAKLEKLGKRLKELEKSGSLVTKLYNHDLPFTQGVDRYAWEIWSGTHPSIQPCDVSQDPGIKIWQVGNNDISQLSWDMAPRHDIFSAREQMDTSKLSEVLDNESVRRRDYFLLPGNIAKWYMLYNTVPAPDSWIWNWFPDGNFWREEVRAHGSAAIEKVSSQYIDKQASGSNNRLAVFYNVYVPSDQGSEGVTRAQNIVQEQLRQIVSSPAAGFGGHNTNVYVNTIGNDKISSSFLNKVCSSNSGVRCSLLKHYPEGQEDLTLQKVYEYCQSNQDDHVMYMHSKGSFHATSDVYAGQDRWRRAGTAAASSKECLDAVSDTYDTCGLIFSPLPGLHYIGNFWTAKCSYINKLIPPDRYAKKVSALGNKLRALKEQGKIVSKTWAFLSETSFGRGRYSAEHWIGSHPSINPCDVSNSSSIGYWLSEDRLYTEEFALANAPRYGTDGDWSWKVPSVQAVLSDEQTRHRDLYLLAGKLYVWLALYKALPSPSSWIWSWFPDGELWRQASLGETSHSSILTKFEKLTSQSKLTKDTAIEGTTRDLTRMSGDIVNRTRPEPRTVITLFYNLYIPADDDSVENAKRIIREQFARITASDIASFSTQPVTLRYNTIGNGNAIDESFMDNLCDGFTCVHMAHYNEGFEDVTLEKMYSYCHENEDHKVIYFHSKGTFHNWNDNTNEIWRRHLMDAIFHTDCLDPPNSTCNLCGLQFYPIWSQFVPGNFFVTECQYVKKLVSPQRFSSEMEAVVEKMKDQKKKEMFVTMMYNTEKEGALGVDRYSSEHWIASNPSVVPCDLSTTADFRYWVNDARDTSIEYKFAMAPRNDVSAPWYRVQTGKRTLLMKDQSLRMREYFLLAGMVFKWLNIYKQLPGRDAWFWSWFPDGELWKQAIELHNQGRSPDEVIKLVQEAAAAK